MIFPLGGMAIGAILGGVMAKRRGGKTADLLQWAAVMAIVCGLIGLFLLIFIERSYV